jgi:hypothetical protein
MHANQKLANVIAGRTVSGVRQDGSTLNLDFSDGSTLQIKVADPASSVMLRDKQGKNGIRGLTKRRSGWGVRVDF